MWQQYNGGAHIPISALQPGDTVFFANTYMPGLSHDGIYIGGAQFIHASHERTGVTVSTLYTRYWHAHYVGAPRPWNVLPTRPAVSVWRQRRTRASGQSGGR